MEEEWHKLNNIICKWVKFLQFCFSRLWKCQRAFRYSSLPASQLNRQPLNQLVRSWPEMFKAAAGLCNVVSKALTPANTDTQTTCLTRESPTSGLLIQHAHTHTLIQLLSHLAHPPSGVSVCVCVIKVALLPVAKAENPITSLYRLAHSLIRA